MNLGQLIGELRSQLEEARARVPAGAPPASGPKLARGDRRRLVLDLIGASRSPLSIAEIRQGAGITSNHASVLMLELLAARLVVRAGAPRHYRYALAGSVRA